MRLLRLTIGVALFGLMSLLFTVPSGALASAATRSWSIEPTPNVASASQNTLAGVSCPSKRDCVAVGYSYTPNIFHVLTETWDGRSWTIQPTPQLPGLGGSLSAVACTSKRYCVAVGAYSTMPGATFGGTLAEIWNGRSWRLTPTPNPSDAPNSALSAVSCTSASDCVAVGLSVVSGGGTQVTLAERWDGRRWTILPTPNPTGASITPLLSVSCSSADACTAVGYTTNALTDIAATFAEVWNGHGWVIQSVPDPDGSPFSQLGSVSCTSAHACIAVGYSFTPFYASVDTLIERWDGHTWTPETAPNENRTFLQSVTCTTSTRCTAVGNLNAGGFVTTVAEVWNGVTWKIETTPNPSGEQAILSAVSCASRAVCTAVGYTASASATLAERSA